MMPLKSKSSKVYSTCRLSTTKTSGVFNRPSFVQENVRVSDRDQVCSMNCLLLTGPQFNQIVNILEGVNWEDLARQLKINQINSIFSACKNEKNPLTCQLGKVITGFINSREPQPCCETLKAIASGVESLPSPDINAASKLRKMCTSTGMLDIITDIHYAYLWLFPSTSMYSIR